MAADKHQQPLLCLLLLLTAANLHKLQPLVESAYPMATLVEDQEEEEEEEEAAFQYMEV